MTSIGETFKRLLDGHPGEKFSVEGGSGAMIITFPKFSYVIDSRGTLMELSGEESKPSPEPVEELPSEGTSELTYPFSEADYPALERALIVTHRLHLDPSAVMEEPEDLWEAAENEVNYLPLGVLDFPGHLPFGWSGGLKDYLKFGEDEKGLYVDVSYIPLGTGDGLSTFEADLKRILERTALGKIITFEQFKLEWEIEAMWVLNHFSSSESYDLTFELVEEKDSETVTPSVGKPLENERFSVEHCGKFYSIYVHSHED